ncbi:hypothetical protein MA16_Dca017661 [Dendrobium catenatum]|uniref:Uncharacterized protein n=1 Tax=Dendrobium catenatum TaxID=906689 RepID=A0A2I0XAB4_9ASPA|nr:hypothetical protein MA16_Dca017661 [Dendrobium catenatum]
MPETTIQRISAIMPAFFFSAGIGCRKMHRNLVIALVPARLTASYPTAFSSSFSVREQSRSLVTANLRRFISQYFPSDLYVVNYRRIYRRNNRLRNDVLANIFCTGNAPESAPERFPTSYKRRKTFFDAHQTGVQ